jgi:ATP-binding cassette subfamily C protein LapB
LALDNAMRPLWEDRHADTIERAVVRGGKTDGFANLGTTLTMLTTVAMTSLGAVAVIHQQMTIGALIAANMLSGRLIAPLNQLVGTWRSYAGFKQSIGRLDALFNSPSDRPASGVILQRPKGEIVLEDVSFAYVKGTKPVIDGVQITFLAGGMHALIGRNGSGKSTLLKLIQGLYQPYEGRALLDGADIHQFGRSEIAGWMAYVPQECVLFSGTLRDNICHRKPDATDEDVIAAATVAGVHAFIIDLPNGYDTDIGEAGNRLSAGQRQRIAIARALIGDPPVLLLDEPSSNLDRQAEIELRNALVRLAKQRTVVIVTHSPILLSVCQDLVALDHGRVALSGPCDEILPKLFGSTWATPPQGSAERATGASTRPESTTAPALTSVASSNASSPTPDTVQNKDGATQQSAGHPPHQHGEGQRL